MAAKDNKDNKQDGGKKVEGYCVKCKESRMMNNSKETKTKNGRLMMKGVCPVCGTTMCKFIPNKK
jgi:hypothetical protein